MALIMPGMYTTTYNATFSKTIQSRPSIPPQSKNSTYARESYAGARLPPLARDPPPPEPKTADLQVVRANIQHSGFWCENPSPTLPSREEEPAPPPPKPVNRFAVHKWASPFAREPILVPAEGEYRTTQRDSFANPKSEVDTLPSHIVMTSTGFQKGLESTVAFEMCDNRSDGPAPTENMKIHDPVGYLEAQARSNRFMSVSKLSYQPPPKRARLPLPPRA
jgi:hypothetical protein